MMTETMSAVASTTALLTGILSMSRLLTFSRLMPCKDSREEQVMMEAWQIETGRLGRGETVSSRDWSRERWRVRERSSSCTTQKLLRKVVRDRSRA